MKRASLIIHWGLMVMLLAGFPWAIAVAADESLCVRVRIEIEQELTLERQGFEARMNVKNGGAAALENISVAVNFTDENRQPVVATSDPNNTTAKFFIRLTSSASLPTQIAGGAEEKLRWLIIPAPGAAAGSVTGKLYYVGATLTYKTSGLDTTVDVSPDSITVKPMPELTLDYFLPNQVYGDDPFTPQIEAAIPFSLGVRIKNGGFGIAHNLKIDSGQPKIIDNQQGLLINFHIEGSEVNGQAATASLLANFGDLQPGRSGVGRWIMTSSLYGKFVEFTATFSHADELGGTLTSLITAVNTHLLVHDILVDLPGRDSVRDFLALDGDTMRVYESDNLDAVVANVSGGAAVTGSAMDYTVTAPGAVGFSYIQVADPLSGNKAIQSVVRSDGKLIRLDNAWLSRNFIVASRTWQYFLNIFDANNTSAASYRVLFGELARGNHAPVLRRPADRIVRPGTYVGMLVQASDPEGDRVTLSSNLLPAGATFTDYGNGQGLLAWTPALGQTGNFPLQFAASDGSLLARDTTVITVTSDTGSLLDKWKESWWPNITNLNIIGTYADPDRDGLKNLLEYALGLDPTLTDLWGLPVVELEEFEGKHYLTMTYEGRTDDSNLHFAVIATNDVDPDIVNWTAVVNEVPISQTEVTPGFKRVKVRDTVATEDQPHRFIKLQVTTSEP